MNITYEKAVWKEIKKLPRILGPNYSQFFKIYIKKKSDKYVLLHLRGENKFISKSVYGDVQYTAFNVNKNLKIKVSNFQDYMIEREKANIIKKEVEHWNGEKHYYKSPAGRNISRIIRTSRKDFKVSVNKLLEIIKPRKILVNSNFMPKVQQNILGVKKKRMCVQCGSIFRPINWKGWSKKYLSIYNVYNCEKCNFKLGVLITEEKDKRKAFSFKMLKKKDKKKSCISLSGLGFWLISSYLIGLEFA